MTNTRCNLWCELQHRIFIVILSRSLKDDLFTYIPIKSFCMSSLIALDRIKRTDGPNQNSNRSQICTGKLRNVFVFGHIEFGWMCGNIDTGLCSCMHICIYMVLFVFKTYRLLEILFREWIFSLTGSFVWKLSFELQLLLHLYIVEWTIQVKQLNHCKMSFVHGLIMLAMN